MRYGVPLADGEMAFKPFLNRLWELGYDAYTTIEWIGERFESAIASELAWLTEWKEGKHV